MIRTRLAAIAVLLASVLPGMGQGMGQAAAQDLIADLSTHLISITSDFTGTELLVFGAIEGGGDVVVIVNVVVRKKDRVFGIWINAESAEFANVPAFYSVAATKPLEDLAAPDQLRLYEIGLNGLRVTPAADVSEGQAGEFMDALVTLKQRTGLFPVAPQHIDVVGDRLFRVKIPFPADVPVGSYLVQSFLIRDGLVVVGQTSPLVVNKGGFGADLYEFAHDEGELYGILAVLGAVMAGLLGNLMFRRP